MMKMLADESALLVSDKLKKAFAIPGVENIIVATHIPPFAGAAWHEGYPSSDEYLPFFSNRSVGDAIVETSRGCGKTITVLCGHTHSPGVINPSVEVECRTGAARYGSPSICEIIEIP